MTVPPTPRSAIWKAGFRRWVRGLAATWLVLGLELVLVGVLDGDRIGSVWEIQLAVAFLAPTALLASAVLASFGVLLDASLDRDDSRAPRLAVACGFGLIGAATAWAVGGGRLLAEPGLRPGFALAIGAAGAAISALAWPRAVSLRRSRPGLLSLGVLLLGLGLWLANRFVLVRLYPAFHLGLAGLVLLLAPLMLPPEIPREGAVGEPAAPGSRRERWKTQGPGWAVVGALLLSALALLPAATWLSRFDNMRIWLLDSAPLLGQAVRLAARVSPPPALAPLDPTCPAGNCGQAGPGKRSLDLSGRDILLITVDALRADHVGAYGYDRVPTTPAIDRLAASGVRFDYAYCPTPHTSYSVTSLMTGKYMRPLLLQGVGEDSDTWASLLRTYDYQTAAFYPPALFFIDPTRFKSFQSSGLGFEYRKQEFLEGNARVAQVDGYLQQLKPSRPLFAWVHLFGPHEPYEAQPDFDFGSRDVDRYDAEIAASDRTVGQIVAKVRKRRPNTVVIVSADHGEEFGDHGGRYHGSSVYEEQVRVPLIIDAPGLLEPRVVSEPVQLIDILPTVLRGLDIPVPPRIRGRDLGPLLRGQASPGSSGFALAETEENSLLAEGSLRLICARQVGACQLFDLERDPGQQRDVSRERPKDLARLRRRVRQLGASHGRFELGAGGVAQRWPAAILRGISGDGDAAPEVASLLDDAEVKIRRKAAEILFELGRGSTAPSLRLTLGRDEDREVRSWCALALTRLGQGAPLVYELLESNDLRLRRLAALALAETGDPRGEAILVAWWKDEASLTYSRQKQLLTGFARIRSKNAVWPLVLRLSDVRLRPHIARSLAGIGEDVARAPLASALAEERYQGSRVAIAEALLSLGAEAELARPLIRFLGVPDPMPGGLAIADRAGILDRIGGPMGRDLGRLREQAELGYALTLFVPKGGNGKGVRLLVRARTRGASGGQVHVGPRLPVYSYSAQGEPREKADVPRLDRSKSASVSVPPSPNQSVEVHTLLPAKLGAAPGKALQLVVFADHNVSLEALALVPLADELPPPAPEPWKPPDGSEDGSR